MKPIPADFHFGLLKRDFDNESEITMLGVNEIPNAPPLIPRSKWQPTNNRRFCWWPALKQIDGMCAANAAAQVPMYLREKAGLPRRVMNASRLYAVHSRDGAGSTLAENLLTLTQYGVPELLTEEQQFYRGPRVYTEDEQDDAAEHRVLEWLDCKGDFDVLASALQAGWVGPIGSAKAFGGAHSVLAVDLIRVGNEWGLSGPNSWGPTWSDDGWYEGPESAFSDMDKYGCWVGLAGTWSA